jgi:hypothetical protein
MNPWVVWGVFAFVAVLLGSISRHFTVRTLRWAAAVTAAVLVVLVTRYGLTHPANASSDLVNAFKQGADELGAAFFHPLLLGNQVPVPGRIGWLVIGVLLVGGYRLLEARAIHRQAPVLDTSALDSQPNHASSKTKDSVKDRQLHDQLAARIKFQLSAIEVRSPAILPGGSRSNGLASIAEASGVTGSGLAGAIIQFLGMLWPNPRRFQVRVRVESGNGHPVESSNGHPVETSHGHAQDADGIRVTVSLDEPATGESIATKTLAGGNLDEAAALAAGYVARHIFIRDPTTPPWCVGATNGRDLAAMLLARKERVYAKCPKAIESARREQVDILEKATGDNQYAGVVRYELAQLYNLQGRHVEALLLHAVNREQHPRFYRGRYRLSMSLEMIANSTFSLLDTDKLNMSRTPLDILDESLTILNRCHVTKNVRFCADDVVGGVLSPGLRKELLEAARRELRAIRRQLTLRHVIWGTFRYRDERLIRRPHWGLRKRQSFHDGLCVAELLVAIRQSLNEKGPAGIGWKPHMKLASRIAAGIAGDKVSIEKHLANAKAQGTPESQCTLESKGRPESWDREWPPPEKRDRTRRLPWQRRTPSWEAAYNTACAYAALNLDHQVVNSLLRAINNPDCEMQRPSLWISCDPDLCRVKSSEEFTSFCEDQKRKDYPTAFQCPAHAGGEEPAAGRDVSSSSPEPAPV